MEDEFLKDFSKEKKPQRVPDGYFDKKKLELIAIAHQEQKPVPNVFKLKAALGWAAGIAAALAIGIFLYPSSPQSSVSPAAEPVMTNASIEEYLLEEYPASAAGEVIIISELTDADLEAISFNALDENGLEEFIDNNFDQTLHYEFL